MRVRSLVPRCTVRACRTAVAAPKAGHPASDLRTYFDDSDPNYEGLFSHRVAVRDMAQNPHTMDLGEGPPALRVAPTCPWSPP